MQWLESKHNQVSNPTPSNTKRSRTEMNAGKIASGHAAHHFRGLQDLVATSFSPPR